MIKKIFNIEYVNCKKSDYSDSKSIFKNKECDTDDDFDDKINGEQSTEVTSIADID